MEIEGYLDSFVEWFLSSGLRILLILILMLICLKAAKIISNRLFSVFRKNKDDEFKKRADTLSSIIRYILSIGFLIITAITIMSELGIRIGPILAAAGIVGFAVGFGAQNLVQDVISGFSFYWKIRSALVMLCKSPTKVVWWKK